MKKVLLSLIAALIMSASAFSQKCNLLIKDGSKVSIAAQSWTNPLLADAKFQKAKDESKDEQITAYNASVSSGKLPAASNYAFIYTASKATLPDGSDEYTLTTNIGGKDYSSYLVCRDDTLFLCRNRGPIQVPDGKGGIYGYAIQGIQKLPVNIKVGDLLPSYDDVNIVFPTTTDVNVKKNVFSHNSTKTTSEFGFATDSRTGESFFGGYTKTTPIAVYKTIDIAVKQTLSSSGHIVHYMFAEVTGEEEVTVSGVKYKAYIIESQTWSKQTVAVSYESAYDEVNKEQKKLYEKMIAKVDKIMLRKQVTNEQGYMVSYLKEWFVPALGGMVKTESYDTHGGIAGGLLLSGLE